MAPSGPVAYAYVVVACYFSISKNSKSHEDGKEPCTSFGVLEGGPGVLTVDEQCGTWGANFGNILMIRKKPMLQLRLLISQVLISRLP